MKKKHIFPAFIALFIGSTTVAYAKEPEDYASQRQQMVEEIAADARRVTKYVEKGTFDEAVIQAMQSTPRHLFVPPQARPYAYENRPLPIGYGQTISQPYIVALMTDLLQPEADHRVLEIGTGSGYQAAVLAHLVDEVYSIEIIAELGSSSTRLLQELGYDNVTTRIADGYDGWPEHAPFDGIIVTAAISHIPPPLVRQLKKGGTMVIPVGTGFQTQQLTLVKKDMAGQITTQQIIPVIFVPFTGGH
jgi:protein-L-isoaspartate(D-aspartate) O-methyltransferase